MLLTVIYYRSKTGMPDVVGSAEERRVEAKELLLQIQSTMGKEAMAQIATAVKNLHNTSIGDLKEHALGILQDRPDLFEKFVEFLPRRFRTM